MKKKYLLCLALLLLVACQPNQSKFEQTDSTTKISLDQQKTDELAAEKAEQALIENAQLTANELESSLLQQQGAELQAGSTNNEQVLIDRAIEKQAELEIDLIKRAKAESDQQQAQLEQMTQQEQSIDELVQRAKPPR